MEAIFNGGFAVENSGELTAWEKVSNVLENLFSTIGFSGEEFTVISFLDMPGWDWVVAAATTHEQTFFISFKNSQFWGKFVDNNNFGNISVPIAPEHKLEDIDEELAYSLLGFLCEKADSRLIINECPCCSGK